MRRGFTAFSATVVDFTLRATAPATPLDSVIKRRRFIMSYTCLMACVPDAIGLSQKRPTINRDEARSCKSNRRHNGCSGFANRHTRGGRIIKNADANDSVLRREAAGHWFG